MLGFCKYILVCFMKVDVILPQCKGFYAVKFWLPCHGRNTIIRNWMAFKGKLNK